MEPEHPTRPAHPTKRPAARPPRPGGPSVRRVTRVLGEYGDRQACLKRIVELKDLHRFSSAGTMIDGINDTAHDTAPWRRILNADRRGWVLIGECTSDIGVHVHRNAIFMCAPALPYVAGCLTVAARPPERRRRFGAFGRRRERPPLWGCLDRHRGGLACARPCHPSPGGRSPPAIPSGKAIKRRCERGVSTNPAAGRGFSPARWLGKSSQ